MDTQTTPSTSPEAAVTATPPTTGSVMDVMPPSGPAAQAPVVAAPATTDSGAEAPVAQAPTAVDVPVDQAHAASAATDTPKESSVPKPPDQAAPQKPKSPRTVPVAVVAVAVIIFIALSVLTYYTFSNS